jgi:hypothetical protein
MSPGRIALIAPTAWAFRTPFQTVRPSRARSAIA